jgi:hypothetical protein
MGFEKKLKAQCGGRNRIAGSETGAPMQPPYRFVPPGTGWYRLVTDKFFLHAKVWWKIGAGNCGGRAGEDANSANFHEWGSQRKWLVSSLNVGKRRKKSDYFG